MGNCIRCKASKTDRKVRDTTKPVTAVNNVSQSNAKAVAVPAKGSNTLHSDSSNRRLVDRNRYSEEYLTINLKKLMDDPCSRRRGLMRRPITMSPRSQVRLLLPPFSLGRFNRRTRALVLRRSLAQLYGSPSLNDLYGLLMRRGIVPLSWDVPTIVRIINDHSTETFELQVVAGPGYLMFVTPPSARITGESDSND